jgi:glutamine amidotransferase
VLELEHETLNVPEGLVPPGPLSWGIGFYQGGEVLLRRRPSDERNALDIARLAKDLRSDLILGHVRAATVGSTRTENTHPFRYREWLFAHTGSLTGSIERYAGIKARLLESIPEFLRKNIRGDTDSEVLFHVVLSFLFDAGRLQDGARAETSTVIAALSSTASLVDQLVAEEGGDKKFALNALLTNGEILASLHSEGTPTENASSQMAMRVVHGRADMDLLVADDALRRVRLTDPGALRFTLLASDFEKGQAAGLSSAWTPLPPRAIVAVTRDASPVVEAF